MDEWTLSDGKHSSLLSTWGYAQSYYLIIALLSDAVKVIYMSIGHNETCIGHTEMSIRPSDKQKCPLDIQMSIRPLDDTNVQWTLKFPFVQWTDGRMDIV